MKEIRKHYTKYYPPLRLYKDDIEEIINIFKKNFKELEITVDKYEIKDVSNLDDIKKNKITYFSVKYHQHSEEKTGKDSEMVTLELREHEARLYLSNEADMDLRGVVAHIDALLTSKRCIQGFLVKYWAIIFYILFIPGGVSLSSFFFLGGLFYRSALLITLFLMGFVLILLSLVGALWVTITNFRKHTIIYLMYSSAKTNFFIRYKDQIIFALTFGIIGTVLGSIITALILNSIIQCKQH